MWYPELASCQSGLRHLVRDDVVFHWSVEMTEQMEATKRLLCGDVYVQPYDTMLVPTILVDGSILYGAGFILVQQDGRFFSAEDYKNSVDVIETTVDGDGLTLQNDSNVSLSEGGGGDISPTTGGGGDTSPTIEMSGDGDGHDLETETTDCMVSKGPTSKQFPVPKKGQDETRQGW